MNTLHWREIIQTDRVTQPTKWDSVNELMDGGLMVVSWWSSTNCMVLVKVGHYELSTDKQLNKVKP